jgi:endonuclease/exonuclease/phosphatase family metal-dependent hydrolase
MIKTHLALILILSLFLFISHKPPKEDDYVQSESFRIVTYNIRHGSGGQDNTVDLSRIAKQIRDLQADVVFLNEVDNRWARSGYVDQAVELSRLTGLPYMYYAPALTTAKPFSEYGNLFLSKVPISDYRCITLPQLGLEPRNLALIQIEVSGIPITIWGTHLSTNRTERRAQIDAITEHAGAERISLLLGDFNTPSDQDEILPLLISGWKDPWSFLNIEENYTYPSQNPQYRVDYIFTSPDVLRAVSDIRVIPSTASDHFPVVIDINLSVLKTTLGF